MEKSNGQPILRQIMPSVLASCIVALIMGGTTFIGTLSKMNMMFEVMERRIASLERSTAEAYKNRKEMEISISKSEVLLNEVIKELKEQRADMKLFHRQPH